MQLFSSLMRSRDLPPQSRDQLYPINWGAAGHVTGEEGHVTSLTSWRAACDISARSFGLPTIYERPIGVTVTGDSRAGIGYSKSEDQSRGTKTANRHDKMIEVQVRDLRCGVT